MDNQVNRFKMYKDGKKWIIAGLAATTLGIVAVGTPQNASADSIATTSVATISSTASTADTVAVENAQSTVTSAQTEVASASQSVAAAQSTAAQTSNEVITAQSAVSEASTTLATANQKLATAQSAVSSATAVQVAASSAQKATLASENSSEVVRATSVNAQTSQDMQAASANTSLSNAGSTNSTATRYAMDGTVYYDASQTQYANAVSQAANWWNTNSGMTLFAAASTAHPATLIITDFNNDLANILATQSTDGTLNLNNSAIEAYGYDAATVLIHELGHTLGIMHDSDNDDIMSATVPNISANNVHYSAYEQATVKISRIVYQDNLAAANGSQSLFEQYNGYTTAPTKAQYSNENYNQWRTLRSALQTEVNHASAKTNPSTELTAAIQTAKNILSTMVAGNVDLVSIKQANTVLAQLYQLSGDTSPAPYIDSNLKAKNSQEYAQAQTNSDLLTSTVAQAAHQVTTIDLSSYAESVANAQAAVTAAQANLTAAQENLAKLTATNQAAQTQLAVARTNQQRAELALTNAQTKLATLEAVNTTIKQASTAASTVTTQPVNSSTTSATASTSSQVTSDNEENTAATVVPDIATDTTTPAIKKTSVAPVFVTQTDYYDNTQSSDATAKNNDIAENALVDISAPTTVVNSSVAKSTTTTSSATGSTKQSTTTAPASNTHSSTKQAARSAASQNEMTSTDDNVVTKTATKRIARPAAQNNATAQTSTDKLQQSADKATSSILPQTSDAKSSGLLALIGMMLASSALVLGGLRRKNS
ncbi:MAG: KxYKxGKxW signal peptide domain-containing protein [Lentilactobacillus diolivorans]|jgi:LPXTG-motif cell wall-anchored protein|nr:KxYKxGKxW signal peptide domain-containing protein [Lentilactobacillus diolivorans]